MHELQVLMLGHRYVGKTSLLAAMYDQFDSDIGNINLQLTPDEESELMLDSKIQQLKSWLTNLKLSRGIEGTEDFCSYIFGIGARGKKPSLQIRFWDYNGLFLSSKNQLENKGKVKQLLKDCTAAIIAIDAPALMEKKGVWNDFLNKPGNITNLFKTAYTDLDSPRLVIFSPVRCEKYMQDYKSELELLSRIQEEYRGLLDLFASEALKDKVAVVVTPVQTVGTVIFSRLEVKDEEPYFHFRKVGGDARYAPKDSEQPLRYLLRFLLKLHLMNRSWGFFDFVRDWFGRDDHLIDAVRKLSADCKSGGAFAILQGEQWLNLGK
jgi:hypothetical protein